jgi:hypothetical protein
LPHNAGKSPNISYRIKEAAERITRGLGPARGAAGEPAPIPDRIRAGLARRRADGRPVGRQPGSTGKKPASGLDTVRPGEVADAAPPEDRRRRLGRRGADAIRGRGADLIVGQIVTIPDRLPHSGEVTFSPRAAGHMVTIACSSGRWNPRRRAELHEQISSDL